MCSGEWIYWESLHDFSSTVLFRTIGLSEKYRTLAVFKLWKLIDFKTESQWCTQGCSILASDILRQCTNYFWKGIIFLNGPIVLIANRAGSSPSIQGTEMIG